MKVYDRFVATSVPVLDAILGVAKGIVDSSTKVGAIDGISRVGAEIDGSWEVARASVDEISAVVKEIGDFSREATAIDDVWEVEMEFDVVSAAVEIDDDRIGCQRAVADRRRTSDENCIDRWFFHCRVSPARVSAPTGAILLRVYGFHADVPRLPKGKLDD